MQPLPGPRARTGRLALVAVSVLVLLAVVAFASRSGFGHAGTARPTPGYVSWAMTVFLILFVAMIPFAVWSYAVQTRERMASRRPFQTRVIRSLLILAVVMLAGLLFAYAKRHLHISFTSLHPPGSSGGLGGQAHKHASHVTTYQPTFKWPVLWGALGLLAASAAAYWWWLRGYRSRLQGRAFEAPPSVAEELAASIGDAIDDLEAEPDARRAVVAAYARMEATLARSGLSRKASETPLEYLRRVLLELTSRGEPVRRLTSLFEQAKFSSHEVDAGMKREAIRSLREIRDDLHGAPA